MMRHVLVPLLLPIAALADDPFACVDPDLIDAFMFGDSQQFSTSVPAELTSVTPPPNFKIVGSRVTGSSMTVVYRSAQDARAALSSSMASLKVAGWKEPDPDSAVDYGAFETLSESAVESTVMCHESAPDALFITAKQRSGRTLISFTVASAHQSGQCMAVSDSIEDDKVWRVPLRKYLPNLSVPADARIHRRGTSGGGDEYSATMVVSTSMNRDKLLQYFDDQLRQQNWMPDSRWSGGSTAGTVWTRNGLNEEPLIGTMRVAQASANGFNVRFTVISTDPRNYLNGGTSSTRSVPD